MVQVVFTMVLDVLLVVQGIVFVWSTQTKYYDVLTIINWIDIVSQMGVLRYSHEIREYIWVLPFG